MSHLREESCLGGRGVKWQIGTDRPTDTPTDRQIKEGPRRPPPCFAMVAWWCIKKGITNNANELIREC
jgi:hypothetical protein